MPLHPSSLDDRSYRDLVEEARRLIPAYDPSWTDHNPSDPGMTLIELFAHLSELLLYRLNRVTDDNQRKFLKLLNGPEWQPGPDLSEDTRNTVRSLRMLYRAVTVTDFEWLSTHELNAWLEGMKRAEAAGAIPDEWWRITGLERSKATNRPSQMPRIARVRCFSARNLDRGTEALRNERAPAHVSIAVVPETSEPWVAHAELRQALTGFLDGRRVLTTRVHVVSPSYAPVTPVLAIVRTHDAIESSLRDRIAEAMTTFLHPLRGGTDGSGWPFGRDVFVSELCEVLERLSGVDYIVAIQLNSVCGSEERRCVAAPVITHESGDLIGLRLGPHHLPRVRIEPGQMLVLQPNSIVDVRVGVTLTSSAVDDGLEARARERVDALFNPLLGGPGPSTATDTLITTAAVRMRLQSPGVSAAVTLSTDANHGVVEHGQVVAIRIKAGECANARIDVTVMRDS